MATRSQNITQTSNFLLLYHQLNLWLLEATNGNQGQTMMHLQCSETINLS